MIFCRECYYILGFRSDGHEFSFQKCGLSADGKFLAVWHADHGDMLRHGVCFHPPACFVSLVGKSVLCFVLFSVQLRAVWYLILVVLFFCMCLFCLSRSCGLWTLHRAIVSASSHRALWPALGPLFVYVSALLLLVVNNPFLVIVFLLLFISPSLSSVFVFCSFFACVGRQPFGCVP